MAHGIDELRPTVEGIAEEVSTPEKSERAEQIKTALEDGADGADAFEDDI